MTGYQEMLKIKRLIKDHTEHEIAAMFPQTRSWVQIRAQIARFPNDVQQRFCNTLNNKSRNGLRLHHVPKLFSTFRKYGDGKDFRNQLTEFTKLKVRKQYTVGRKEALHDIIQQLKANVRSLEKMLS